MMIAACGLVTPASSIRYATSNAILALMKTGAAVIPVGPSGRAGIHDGISVWIPGSAAPPRDDDAWYESSIAQFGINGITGDKPRSQKLRKRQTDVGDGTPDLRPQGEGTAGRTLAADTAPPMELAKSLRADAVRSRRA